MGKQPKNKVRSYNIDDVEDVDVKSVEDEENEIKRTSTLDMVKNGIMSAKKRLLSPESIENEQEYEHKEIENEQEHKRKKKDSDSLNKKSLNLFSKGKGLFARNGSSKDLMDGNPLNDDLKHNKTSSKSNLSAFKDKLQKFKNKKTSTPKQSQNRAHSKSTATKTKKTAHSAASRKKEKNKSLEPRKKNKNNL